MAGEGGGDGVWNPISSVYIYIYAQREEEEEGRGFSKFSREDWVSPGHYFFTKVAEMARRLFYPTNKHEKQSTNQTNRLK